MALMKRLVSLRLVVLVGGALLAWGVSVWDGGIGKTDPDIAERPPIAQARPPAPLRDLGTGASPVHGKPAPKASRKRVTRLDRDSGRERRVESEETVRQVVSCSAVRRCSLPTCRGATAASSWRVSRAGVRP